jgi:glycosyltransferase involved in cell wall biosynthesis
MKTHLKNNNIIYLHTTGDWWDQRIFYKQMPALEKAGFNITYLISTDDEKLNMDYDVINIPKSEAKKARYTGGISLLKIIELKKYDVFQICNIELLPLGVIIKAITKKKVFYDCREDHFNSMLYSKVWFPKSIRVILAYIVKGLEAISQIMYDGFIVSDPAIYKMNKYMPENKKILFHNLPLKSQFENIENKNAKKYDLVVLGSMSMRTGVLDVIKAISVLKKQGINIKIKLVGDPSKDKVLYENIKNIVRDECLECQVQITGKIPYSKIPEELTDCKIGLVPLLDMPKFRNNIAAKQFEYMAAGLPVIASMLPPQKIYIEEGHNGMFYKAGDVKELVEKIKYLHENPNEISRMGENGKKLIMNHLYSEKEQDEYAIYYVKSVMR